MKNSDIMGKIYQEAEQEYKDSEKWLKHAMRHYPQEKDMTRGFKDELIRGYNRKRYLKSRYDSLRMKEQLEKQSETEVK